MPSSLDARVSAVRRRLERTRGALLTASVESMEESLPDLAEAAGALGALSGEISRLPPASGAERQALVREVNGLRTDLSRLAALAAQGLEFCGRWSHVLQCATLSSAGYLPSGEAERAPAPTSILVRG